MPSRSTKVPFPNPTFKNGGNFFRNNKFDFYERVK
jgi:hypothetical protein